MAESILYGKKVVLFDFRPEDLEHFVKLHREDKFGYMQQYCLKKMTQEEGIKFVTALILSNQIKCWAVYIKNNKGKNCAGFIYLSNMTSFSANISGIMDVEIIRGLLKQIRHDKYTFAEDSIRTLISHCFNGVGLSRIETTVLSNNRRALALDKKIGFVNEGRFREAFQMDNAFYDVIQLAILKREWNNGKK